MKRLRFTRSLFASSQICVALLLASFCHAQLAVTRYLSWMQDRTPDAHFEEPYLAAVFDLFAPPGRRSDFAFYLPMIMRASSVLDIGCGTGALLHRARQEGHTSRLCGLDPATGMLEQARKIEANPAIVWVQGDLSSAAWRNEFDLIVMTGHAFQVLLTDEQLHEALSAVRNALKSDGRFAFETRNPIVRSWEKWNIEYSDEVIDHNGAAIRASHKTHPPVGELVSFSTTYTSSLWPEPMVSHSTLRFLSAKSLEAFLNDAGLVIVQQFGDWDRSPATGSSPEIITIARRA